MHRLSPRVVLALPLLLVVLIVAGCEDPTIASKDAGQVDQIGPMGITTVIEACSNGSPLDNMNCAPQGELQLLVGYRVPAGASSPDTVPSSGPHDTSSTTFRKSASYASELQRLAAAPAGQQWIGYISDELNLNATTTDPDRETLAPGFTLPAGSGGSVFKYGMVVGDRFNNTVTDVTRPVVCNLTNLNTLSSDGSTTCATNPTLIADIETDFTGPTINDLGLTAGTAPTVHGGDTATVPFVATLVGPGLTGGPLTLSASSPLAGSTAAPGSPTLAPSPGDSATAATLKVPASAPAGDYPVTLTATSGGQTRHASGTVHVLAVPGLVITFKPRSLTVKKGFVTLPISCPGDSIDPCAGKVSLTTAGKVLIAKKRKKKARRRALKLGSGKFTLAPGASGTVKIKLPKAGKKALARTGRLGAKATFVMTNRAGKTSTTVKRLTLHGPKARTHRRRK